MDNIGHALDHSGVAAANRSHCVPCRSKVFIVKNWGCIVPVSFLVVLLMAMMTFPMWARDDGRYAASPLKSWFDSLRSDKGPCCSDADGTALADPDWTSKDGHYRVRLDNEWFDVPDAAVLKQPNLYGRTMVWPLRTRVYGSGITEIRCFIPGSMS